MAFLKIAKMGHPVLRQRALPVADVAASEIGRLITDMIDTMVDAGGVGLAAPQVYQSSRVIVYRLPPDRVAANSSEIGSTALPNGAAVLINPVIEPVDHRMVLAPEGCLSIPSLRGLVPRYASVRYSGLDGECRPVAGEAHGFHARVLQHEVDHLDGVLFPDRMTDLTSLAFESELHHFLEEKIGA